MHFLLNIAQNLKCSLPLPVQPVAFAELHTSVSATGSLSFSYDNPKALTLHDLGIEVKDFNTSVVAPRLTMDLDKNIVPHVSIQGKVQATGFLRIGPEIIVEVCCYKVIVLNFLERYLPLYFSLLLLP